MIAALIRWSVVNRFLVLIATAFLIAAGVWSVTKTPLDALPDLSDTQVIVRTPFPGKAPQVVEDLVTYPMTTTMLSVPGAKTVRGYSFFGDSFVYVLFDDKTDPYWARSRVVEYLNQVQSRLPPGASASLGPDATGVGWVYEYALVDRSGTQDLSQLRSLNDWFLKFELKTVPDVAEVASIGGMVRQYQVVLDPDRMRTLAITQATVIDALQKANQATGGSVVELAEAEYMVRSRGYLRSLDDFRSIPLSVTNATPVLLRDVATVQLGPELRRGIAELDGQGEVAGGVVVMRSGKNARTTIEAVKAKLESLKSSLPPGVEIVSTYDRSQLIDRAVDNLRPSWWRSSSLSRWCARFSCFTFARRWSPSWHCRSACWRRSSSCAGKASTPTSCRWAGSRSRSAPWWMHRSSWSRTCTSTSKPSRHSATGGQAPASTGRW